MSRILHTSLEGAKGIQVDACAVSCALRTYQENLEFEKPPSMRFSCWRVARVYSSGLYFCLRFLSLQQPSSFLCKCLSCSLLILVSIVQGMNGGSVGEGTPKTQEQCRIKVSGHHINTFCFFHSVRTCFKMDLNMRGNF